MKIVFVLYLRDYNLYNLFNFHPPTPYTNNRHTRQRYTYKTLRLTKESVGQQQEKKRNLLNEERF